MKPFLPGLAVLCAMVLVLAGVVRIGSSNAGAARATPSVRSATAEATGGRGESGPSPTASRTSARIDRGRLTRAVDRALRGDARLSVAVRDLTTGAAYTYGTSRRFVTASVVKVDILVALLMKARRQKRRLTAEERALAARMIVHSDNAATDALWSVIGGAAGLTWANRRLGLRETTATSASWGLTGTSARDQVRLLEALTSDDGPLTGQDRRYVLGLMAEVGADQGWGVSAGAAPGDAVALKNGWLPRSTDGGRWVINSIGRLDCAGHEYLVAVLSDRNTSMESGVAMVERVAETVLEGLP